MSLTTTIANYLAADATLAEVATGGVLTRSLKKTPPGATTSAFTASGQTKPTVVVKDRGEESDVSGPGDAYMAFPQIWLYAPTTTSGHSAIEAMFIRIKDLLHGTSFPSPYGTGVGVTIIGRMGADDDPVLPATLVDMVRLQADGLWGA